MKAIEERMNRNLVRVLYLLYDRILVSKFESISDKELVLSIIGSVINHFRNTQENPGKSGLVTLNKN